ncbi:TRAP transporter substrate-binding protein [Oceanobacillus indicireducens]|uniref:TRAP transporter substrate-binding protein n=1 Tax=Oceanobacillus indicireducens TaxID=1004261 RepID=A0A917XYG4_9BACI|nr:TRAP transporter substrate-binding protein [Oceanobacillus indicireducens]GGN59655.1 hypothetical protein GCM10007971_23030 [Oceanobacillus indicireducens]
MKYKKTILLLTLILILLLVSACGDSASSEGGTGDGTIQLKSADVVAGDSPYNTGMEQLSETLAEKTDGQIELNHFPAGQLGNDGQIVDGIKIGSIDIGMVGTISSKVTEALYLPFLFEDSKHMHEVLDGEIGEDLKSRFEEETGIKMIGFVYYGPRVLTTDGLEVNTPDDLKGLKIRVPEMPPMVSTWKALGANPTPIAFTELFSSLEQGVVDAQENPLEIIVNNSFFEVQDTLIETYHSLPLRFLIMNKEKYESLSEEHQELLQEEWDKTSLEIEKLYKEQDDEYRQIIEDHGVKFIQPDVESFKEATKDVWKEYAPEAFGDGVYEKIEALKDGKNDDLESE